MQTRSTNQQNLQKGRKSLGLSLLVQIVGMIQQAGKCMAQINSNWSHTAQANLAAAGTCQSVTPAHPIYRDESAGIERGFSSRMLDWSHRIRGGSPPSRYR